MTTETAAQTRSASGPAPATGPELTIGHWLRLHMRHFRRHIAVHLTGSLLWQSLTAALPLVIGLAFDAVLKTNGREPDLGALHAVCAALLALVLVRGVCGIASTYALEAFASGLERDARAGVFASMLRKKQGFFNRHRTGDLSTRATGDAEALGLMVSPGFDMTLDMALNTLIPLVFIAAVDWRLLLFPGIFVVLFVAALMDHGRRLEPVSDLTREEFGAMSAQAAESITGIEAVEATDGAEREQDRFRRTATAYRDAAVAQARVQALSFPPLLLAVATAGTLLHAVFLLRDGSLSVGELVAVLGLMSTLRAPTQLASFSIGLIFFGLSGAQRILEIINDRAGEDEEGGRHEAVITGEVVFENVTFAYGNGKPVLRDISFRAAPGTTVAVVGATGSGKSTLLHLLNRTYVPTEGRVLVDDVATTAWDPSALRGQVAVVEQDVVLFSRTIAENLAFGAAPDTGRAQLEEAARTAQAHDFVMASEHGYDTVLGERGVTLSGGQRQRLAIARALVTDPRILAVDDATSAVDSVTEHELQLAMRRAATGRTTFLVTPRLSRIRAADHIVVLDAGRVVGQGTHEHLLRTCAFYRTIFAPYALPAAEGTTTAAVAAGAEEGTR
ncbi:ABC transporter ATP-binding protein [Streptomyces sp. ERV7]|uniref:ABC transporter ATP-binding protein n=1 Tax=Streptomyces sp. ERV7 TaxID=1322334 RepID=UPI000A417FBF|nr:ABC transporter ATP-binding protein [Streptomyces sp. ERV7]